MGLAAAVTREARRVSIVVASFGLYSFEGYRKRH